MSKSNGSQTVDLLEDFLENISSLYSMFGELQANDSTKPARAVHPVDCMLEPMACWKTLKEELRTSGVLDADEEVQRIVHQFGEALESLDAAATVYDNIEKYPHSLDTEGSHGDWAYRSRPPKSRRRLVGSR